MTGYYLESVMHDKTYVGQSFYINDFVLIVFVMYGSNIVGFALVAKTIILL